MNWRLLTPEIIVFLTLVAVLAADMLLPKSSDRRAVGYIGFVGIIIAVIATLTMFGTSETIFEGIFVVDTTALFFKILFLVSALLVFIMSFKYLEGKKDNKGEFFWLSLAALLGMMVTAASRELIAIYIGIELISLSFYALVGFQRDNKQSTEAALKYFVLGSFAIAIWLLGAAYIYGLTGTTDLVEIAKNLSTQASPILYIAIFLLIVGFGFKLGLAPFHLWVPDAYQGAPAPITAFLAVGSKAAAFAVFIRVMFTAFIDFSGMWSVVLGILAIATMFWGNLAALRQKNIKRMLAYSAVAHAGYLLIGVVTATLAGAQAVMFYLFGYLFANLGAFAVVVAFSHFTGSDLIEDYAGLRWRNPFMAFILTLCLLSMAGIPPLAGFLGKFYLFWTAMQQGGWLIYLVILGAINSAISLFYYVNVIKTMYFKEPGEEKAVSTSPMINVTLLVCAAGLLLAVFYFQPLINIFESGTVLSLMIN